MNITSIDRILTSKDIARGKTHDAYLNEQAAIIRAGRGVTVPISTEVSGDPVKAYIYQGMWIAQCECNGATFVDPDDRRFMCFSCGNRANDGKMRPVLFPDNYQEIEQVILQRPVNDMAGLTPVERAGLSKPIIAVEGKGGLARNWNHSETVDDLHQQQDEAIKKWKKDIKRK